jgi:hypothetical protein
MTPTLDEGDEEEGEDDGDVRGGFVPSLGRWRSTLFPERTGSQDGDVAYFDDLNDTGMLSPREVEFLLKRKLKNNPIQQQILIAMVW